MRLTENCLRSWILTRGFFFKFCDQMSDVPPLSWRCLVLQLPFGASQGTLREPGNSSKAIWTVDTEQKLQQNFRRTGSVSLMRSMCRGWKKGFKGFIPQWLGAIAGLMFGSVRKSYIMNLVDGQICSYSYTNLHVSPLLFTLDCALHSREWIRHHKASYSLHFDVFWCVLNILERPNDASHFPWHCSFGRSC